MENILEIFMNFEKLNIMKNKKKFVKKEAKMLSVKLEEKNY